MGGAFLTSRDIFQNPIWQDIPKFRIFFYIVGNAIFSHDGVMVGDIHVKRGQYLRSYRNLAEDLEYIENRKVKKYSISVLSRKIDQLVKEERLKVESTDLGTLFTVVNYEHYQAFDSYRKKEHGTELEQSWNGDGTELEQSGNNNNEGINVNNVNAAAEENQLKIYEQIKSAYMKFAGLGGFEISPKDQQSINTLMTYNIPINKVIKWLEECFQEYKPKHQFDKINSFAYCLPKILDKYVIEKEEKNHGNKIHQYGANHGRHTKENRSEPIFGDFVGRVPRRKDV